MEGPRPAFRWCSEPIPKMYPHHTILFPSVRNFVPVQIATIPTLCSLYTSRKQALLGRPSELPKAHDQPSDESPNPSEIPSIRFMVCSITHEDPRTVPSFRDVSGTRCSEIREGPRKPIPIMSYPRKDGPISVRDPINVNHSHHCKHGWQWHSLNVIVVQWMFLNVNMDNVNPTLHWLHCVPDSPRPVLGCIRDPSHDGPKSGRHNVINLWVSHKMKIWDCPIILWYLPINQIRTRTGSEWCKPCVHW